MKKGRAPDAHLFHLAGVGNAVCQQAAVHARRIFHHVAVQDFAAVHHGEEGQDAQVSVPAAVAELQQLIEGAQRQRRGYGGHQQDIGCLEHVLRHQ